MNDSLQTEHVSRKNGSKRIVLGVAFIVVFLLGIFVGSSYDLSKKLTSRGSVNISKVIDLYSKTRNPEVSFTQYWDVWDKIKQKYVNQPVDDVSLFYGSLEGLVAGLNDPYSIYFPPKKAQEFAQDLSGELEGIGAEIGMRDNQITVIAPLPKSPAEKAGIRAGDKILAIDGKDTASLSLDEAVSKIRGTKGTKVMLTITNDGIEKARDVSIIRETIDVPTIDWSMKENGVVYLRISYFNDNTWSQFDAAVKQILTKLPKGIILDLRSNPGGYLDTSVQVASEWVKDGVIVSERFNSDKTDEYKTQGAHRFAGIPTIVLVDEGTASGSEIVAGALKDYGVAQLVGTKTFGKGSVQDFEVLPDGSALKLTIAKWLTPKGTEINGKGIEPDIAIKEMFVQKPGTDGKSPDNFTDAGMEKALELLKSR